MKHIYVIFDAVNCTPNGDPDENGKQRYNDENKKAYISDLRIKRFARNKLIDLGIPVFYEYDRTKIAKKATKENEKDSKQTGAEARFKSYRDENKLKYDGKSIEEILKEGFVDARIFGAILTMKKGEGSENVHVTGALQFDAETKSVNDITSLVENTITTAFPSSDDKKNGSMGKMSYIRYGLFCTKGRYSSKVAALNNTTDNDLNLILYSTYLGINEINTRSKYGLHAIAIVVIDTEEILTKSGKFISDGKTINYDFQPFDLNLKVETSENIMSRNDYDFNFEPLYNKLTENNVKEVTIISDESGFIDEYFSNKNPKLKIVNPYDGLIKIVEDL
jgi:CRISPR-associated protein Csh2